MTKSQKIILGLVAGIFLILVVAGIGGIMALRSVINSGATAGPDQMFGDQHLKTAVALVELHKVRYGHYPASLRELKFVGTWDQGALASVRYVANPEGTAYYLEVERGWVGKPKLEMPPEFWQGTGYRPDLKPADW